VPDPGADEDREGNLWVGTNGGGLERVQRRVFELERVAQGSPSEMVQSLSEDIRARSGPPAQWRAAAIE